MLRPGAVGGCGPGDLRPVRGAAPPADERALRSLDLPGARALARSVALLARGNPGGRVALARLRHNIFGEVLGLGRRLLAAPASAAGRGFRLRPRIAAPTLAGRRPARHHEAALAGPAGRTRTGPRSTRDTKFATAMAAATPTEGDQAPHIRTCRPPQKGSLRTTPSQCTHFSSHPCWGASVCFRRNSR